MPSKKPQILIRTTEENKKKIEAIAEEQKRSYIIIEISTTSTIYSFRYTGIAITVIIWTPSRTKINKRTTIRTVSLTLKLDTFIITH